MIDTRPQVVETMKKLHVLMRRLAGQLWAGQGHELGEWVAVDGKFVGWTQCCPLCGEACVVQILPPQRPIAYALTINMTPDVCGDRTYVDPQAAVQLTLCL